MRRSRPLQTSPRSLVALRCGALAAALTAVAAGPAFVDRAAETGLDFVHFNGMSGELYFSEMMGSGAAFVDYDDDGDLDVFLVQGAMLGDKDIGEATFSPPPGPLIDRLYRNDTTPAADGTRQVRFVDVTATSGLVSDGYGMGVASGDYDGDGDVDLYVTNAGPNQLWRNNGDGSFGDATAESGTGDRGWSVSAAFFDYDDDGRLDLYVGNYVEYRVANDKKCVSQTGASDYCGPLAYTPQPDRLYRNLGGGRFEDVSSRSGIGAEPGGGLGVVVADLDANGRLDVYVANDQSPNKLWLNQGDGTFLNESLLSGTAVNEMGQPEASMGVVVGDLDADGDEDLFMAHLTRETNTLYLNEGGGLFVDGTRDSGLGLPSWSYTGFGVALLDVDLDGLLDLFVANGAVKRLEERVREGDELPLDQANQLFRNLGGGRFAEVTAAAGEALALVEVSRGAAVGDYDNDGDPDLLVTNTAGPARLLENRTQAAGAWLGVRLLGDAAAAASGALVAARGGERSVVRRVATSGSYASAGDSRVLLAVGDGDTGRTGGPTLETRWPDGRVVRWRPTVTGVYFTLYAGGER